MATSSEIFEVIGDLYYQDTGHLRPGKSDPLRDTSTEENQLRFLEWYRLNVVNRLVDQILAYSQIVVKLENRIDDLDEALLEMKLNMPEGGCE